VPAFEVPASLGEEETLTDGDGAGLGLGLRLPFRDASLLNLDPDKKTRKTMLYHQPIPKCTTP
jgi:hypothetical protein